jgi:hypothetical protein
VGRLGKQREIDMRSDVLFAGMRERIGVGAMPVMAHQRAARALRVVVLAAREAVVDDEDRALLQVLDEVVHPCPGEEIDLAHVRPRHLDLLRRGEHLALRLAVAPGERPRHAALEDVVLRPVHEVHGHCVDHLVGDDRSPEPVRQFTQEMDTGTETDRLTSAQLGARLEDEVLAAEPLRQHFGEGARAGADLEHRGKAGERARQRAAEEIAELGRGDEVAARAELALAARVIAGAGLVQGELHVARKADPAAARGDFLRDAGRGGHAGNLLESPGPWTIRWQARARS